MIDKLIAFSIHNKLVIGLFVLALVAWGAYSLKHIPIDAVPDITTNQVQVITQTPTLATQEVEQFVTFPIEVALANLPDVEEVRSISRFGLSVVTVVFEDEVDIYRGRQLISEQLKIAEDEIPEGFGSPELGPISTGLGEVYQYILHTAPGYEDKFTDMELRSINDWIVKRQLAGTPGVIEVSGWGGHLKQYEVALDPRQLNSMGISISEVHAALAANNENTGGSYIEKRFNTYFIRGEGLVKDLADIEKIVVRTMNGVPVLVRDVAKVGYGSAPRYGALTWNGHGEVVGGQTLMLKGENSFEVVEAVKNRVEEIRKSLPEGVIIEPYLDRSELVGRAIGTVTKNLLEGGLIVILILVLLLGNFRGGLIVASVIPLAMLFAVGMMQLFGVSANLMSLGAIDFGLVVDGSVIIVESILHRLTSKFSGQRLDKKRMDLEVNTAASKIRSSAAFGEIIILIVYLPILALVGIEGKMFKPMAQTVSFAIGGALILSMTYVPMMSALFLKKTITNKRTLSDRFIGWLQKLYSPVLEAALRRKTAVVIGAVLLFAMSLFTFNRLGGEFLPVLEEGDLALHQILPPGSSLQQSVEVSEKIQRVLLDEFPEVEMVVSKIGTSELPTDPMPIEVGDIIVKMAPKDEWVSASNREELFEEMEKVLSQIPGVQYEFTQPIQMRFNELIAGVREDIAIKIFGGDPELLFTKAKEAKKIINAVPGVGDLRVEQIQGLPQMMVTYERNKIAQYGLNIRDLNTILRTAFAGEAAGVVFEDERRFDLVVRLEKRHRQDIDDIRNLFVPLPNGGQIPLKEVARIEMKEGPMQISRDDAKRRIVIGVNARDRDIESLVAEIDEKLEAGLDLPPGYHITYGGQFENLVKAKERLSIAVPAALLLIMVLLFFTFKSIGKALLIFTAIPFSAIGGVYALWLRDMPFSISAGVGFIALFGVAVLNGIVLVAYFDQLKKEGMTDMKERIFEGTKVRLRPVIMTAAVAAFGFLPMAISSSAGAEVQRPLATVVIGGLLTATLLTLVVLPVLYSIFDGRRIRGKGGVTMLTFLFLLPLASKAQEPFTVEKAVAQAMENHPTVRAARLGVEQQEKLKATAFDLDKTNVSYTQGQLNSAVIDHQWQVSQKLRFPTSYIARSKLQNEKVQLQESMLALTELELERNVRSAWWQLAYGTERLKVVNALLADIERFAEAAEKRYRAGEIGLLEKTSAEGRFQQFVLLRAQAETDLEMYRELMRQWSGTETVFNLPENAFQRELATAIDTAAGALQNYYAKNVDLASSQLKAERTAYLPDLNVGYLNQQIEGVPGMTAFQVGVDVPLFFWKDRGNVQAAKISSEMAQAEYEGQILALNAERNKLQQEVHKQLLQVEWYEQTGAKTATELLRFADKGYRSGEIDHLEYINSTEQAVLIKMNYLDALHLYQQALLDLNFLNGNF